MQRLNAKVRRWGAWARYARMTRSAGARPNASCRARGAGAPRPSSDSMSSRRRWTRCAGRWSRHPHRCIAPSTSRRLSSGAAHRVGGEVHEAREVPAQPGTGVGAAQKACRLKALAEPWSAQAVSLACICWYLVRALHKRPARARYRALYRHLLAAYGVTAGRRRGVRGIASPPSRAALRARSANLGVHVRPYLYVQGATQGDLFRPGPAQALGTTRGPALTPRTAGAVVSPRRRGHWAPSTALGTPAANCRNRSGIPDVYRHLRTVSEGIADFASIRAESRAPVAPSHHLTEPTREWR